MLCCFRREALVALTKKTHLIPRFLTPQTNGMQMTSLSLQSTTLQILEKMFCNQLLSTSLDLHGYFFKQMLLCLLLLIIQCFCHLWSLVFFALSISCLKLSDRSLKLFKWLGHIFCVWFLMLTFVVMAPCLLESLPLFVMLNSGGTNHFRLHFNTV